MSKLAYVIRKLLRLSPQGSAPASLEKGELYVDNTTGAPMYHNGSSESQVVTAAHSATLTNKTLVAASNTITTAASGNLSAVELNAALSELQTDIDTRATSADFSSHTGASTGVHGVTGAVVGTTDSQSLTNKTIDADQNTISNIENADIKAAAAIDRTKLASGNNYRILANDSSGVMSENAALTASRAVASDANGQLVAAATTVTELGYVNGVTSAIQTQLDAKIAKSLVTTKGDLITATGSATPVRLGVGADNLFLKANSGTTEGIEWASAVVNFAVTSKTSNYTLVSSDDIVLGDSSGGTFTLTLPTAVGATGKIYKIKKTDSSFTEITIATTSSQTIDGSTTTTVNTQNECIEVISDGSNWQILTRRFPNIWTSATITGSWVTNATYSGKFRRVGDSMELGFVVDLTGAPTATSLTITIPNSLTIDTAKLIGTGAGITMLPSNGVAYDATGGGSANLIHLACMYSSSTAVLVVDLQTDDYSATNATSPFTWATGDQISGYVRVPITGWKG